MKRLIPAAVILFIIIVICVIGNLTVCKSIKTAKSEINSCQTLYNNGNFDEAYANAVDFKERWNKTVTFTSVYANHCPLDDVSALAAVLPEAVKQRNTFYVNSTAEQIFSLLDAVLNEQSLTLQSLY